MVCFVLQSKRQSSLRYIISKFDSFSLNHSLPYTFVGIQCIYATILFPEVYWNTACLIVNSGAKDENDTKIAIDTLQNALDIEKAIPSPLIRENIEYNILKLKFKTPDNSVLKAANDFVEYSKNNSFNKELSALAGDYCAAQGNNELALIYYQNAEVFAEKIDEIKSPELLELYNKIIALDPQKEPEYIEKISSLQDTKDLSTKQLIDAFEFNFKKNDNERIMSMATLVSESSTAGSSPQKRASIKACGMELISKRFTRVKASGNLPGNTS